MKDNTTFEDAMNGFIDAAKLNGLIDAAKRIEDECRLEGEYEDEYVEREYAKHLAMDDEPEFTLEGGEF